jgi:hypothetical protein
VKTIALAVGANLVVVIVIIIAAAISANIINLVDWMQ